MSKSHGEKGKLTRRDSGAGEKNPLDALTDREFQVLEMLADGLNSRQIAERVNLSVSTVKYHRKNLFDKLGFSNIAQLVRFAVERGIVKST